MSTRNQGEAPIYTALVNGEGQYCLWQKAWPVPRGWGVVDIEGDRQQVIDHVQSLWTDMRPRGLRAVLDDASVEVTTT